MEPLSQDQATQINAPIADQQAPAASEDPGKTLGIIGLVLAFVGVHLIGLILSIIGYRKSAKAGFKNTLALVGIILNALFMVLTITGILLLVFFLAIPSVQKLQDAKSKCEELGVGTHRYVSIRGDAGTLTCSSGGSFEFSSPNFNFESSN